MKVSYKNSSNKKELRSKIIPKGNKIIGLAGPDFTDYVEFLKEKGYNNIRVWENNPKTLLSQISYMPTINHPVHLNKGDIYEAPVEKNTIYDLDFCCQMKSIEKHVKKFQNSKYILTVSEMRIKRYSSIPIFFSYLDERVTSHSILEDNSQLFVTNKQHSYHAWAYSDTSPMLMIKNF